MQKTLYKLGSPKYMISVSSKYMVQNTQCIIHGPVGKEVFWANSPKYIVQNEPSRQRLLMDVCGIFKVSKTFLFGYF